MDEPDYIRAHRRSISHRDEIEASEKCGCFYCGAIFSPAEITDWLNESKAGGQTALCPRCSIDSVIGSQSGFPITPEFLSRMNGHWFGVQPENNSNPTT